MATREGSLPEKPGTSVVSAGAGTGFIPATIKDEKLYGHCFIGYQYRDQLIPQEFSFMTQSFFLLLTIMGVARSLPTENEWIPRILALVIGLAGFFALFAYLLDLHANATCKGRLRSMMVQMELGETTTDDPPPKKLERERVAYWHFIANRSISSLESVLRWIFRTPFDFSATKAFMLAAYVYLFVWIGLTVLFVSLPKFPALGK